MRAARVWWRRLCGLVAGERIAREISAELEAHLELHIADQVRAGTSPEEARRQAILQLGGISAVKEAYRDRSSVPALEHLRQDVRFAVRQLWRNSGFAATAMLVLALGIGAATAIFAFVDAALLKPLPYKDPSRLMSVDESTSMFPRSNVSYFDYLDWKRENKVFTSLDVYRGAGYLLKDGARVQMVDAARVSAGFFQTLSVAPQIGRLFRAGEDAPNAPHLVMLSYAAWQRRFGGDVNVVGRGLVLSGDLYTVIGVLPARFEFGPVGGAELWTAIDPAHGCEARRSCHDEHGVGRLRPGVSAEAALREMKMIAGRLEKEYPDSNRGQSATVTPLADVITGPVRPLLVLLMSGALLLLALAVVNVNSLLLVRSESRRLEMAVRTSLGASRGRMVMQFLTEASVLLGAGGLMGLACAAAGIRFLLYLAPADMVVRAPYLRDAGFNAQVLAFGLTVAAAAAVCFGVTPLALLPKGDPHAYLSAGGRWSAGLSWRRFGSKLVVVELATTVVLLVSAGLLAKSLYVLLHVNVGFEPDHLAAATVAAPDNLYGAGAQQTALARRIVAGLRTLPGVTGAALANDLPVSCNCDTDWIRIVGAPFDGRHEDVLERDATPDYFRTMGVKLLRGRFFDESEDASKAKVVVVNQAFVRKYFPHVDPIGQQIGDLKLDPTSLRQVIGVVENIREGTLEDDFWPAEYLPFSQDPGSYFNVVVRTKQDEHGILAQIRGVIQGQDPGVGVSDEISLDDRIRNSPAAYVHRSSTWLVGGFAAVALLLSVIGLYGVVAFSVSRRTREIGVRMALGAEPGAVYWLVLREAGWLTALGIAGGVAGSLGLSEALRRLLFGVEPWDATTLTGVSVLLAAAAILAAWVPARRAARLDPVNALRVD